MWNRKKAIILLIICISCYYVTQGLNMRPVSSRFAKRKRSFHTSMSTTNIANEDEVREVMSPAEMVAKAHDQWEVLRVAEHLVLPGEEKLHYQSQLVHQRKRCAIGTNALKRLLKFMVGVSKSDEKSRVLREGSFRRICIAASSPLIDEKTGATSAEKSDVSNYVEVVRNLGALGPLPEDIALEVVYPLIASLCSFLPQKGGGDKQNLLTLTSPEIARLEWAYRRIRISDRPAPFEAELQAAANDLKLPFKVFHALTKGLIDVNEVRDTVPFRSEKLQTRDGRSVTERRETCWMADPGIGGLAYSGKIMEPVPFCESVARVRDAIEAETGHYFDCCLINWYGDGDCACKFHSDPDHGRLWSLDAMVVSIGETRRFHLRKIPEKERGTPQQYGSYGAPSSAARSIRGASFGSGKAAVESEKKQETEQDHYTYHVYDGDVFYMFDDCQDTYQHCVMKSEGENNNSPRASIVFKKSLPGPGGKRGHGLHKSRVSVSPASTPKASNSTPRGPQKSKPATSSAASTRVSQNNTGSKSMSNISSASRGASGATSAQRKSQGSTGSSSAQRSGAAGKNRPIGSR